MPLCHIAVAMLMLPLAAAYSQAMVTDIEFHWETHQRLAPGSDNWPITWADDDHQYTAWGDGGGFEGTNRDGRVSLGVARVEGDTANYRGFNVFGGKNAENPAVFPGKSYGLLSIDGIMYMWVMVEELYFRESELYSSADHGATWTSAGWRFADLDGAFSVPTFLNFGKDYAGARDSYVYIYAPGAKRAGFGSTDAVDLARVAKDRITNRNEYEFFAGLDATGAPNWSRDIDARRPVLTDRGDVHWTVGVGYSPGLDRYFLFNNCRPNSSQKPWTPTDLDVYEAATPWGPWQRIKTFRKWNDMGYTFSYFLAPKWISADGRDFTLVFSGTGRNDSWNTVQGSFIVADQPSGSGSFGPLSLLFFLVCQVFIVSTRRVSAAGRSAR